VLDEVVVVAVEAVKNVLRELLIAKRLPNGRQCVRERLHLVEVVMAEESSFLQSPSWRRRAVPRAVDCCENVCSSVLHMSKEDEAKSTRPATLSVKDDYNAETMAWSWAT
jgi:hypothetical protein